MQKKSLKKRGNFPPIACEKKRVQIISSSGVYELLFEANEKLVFGRLGFVILY
jgi:prophage antirepressor-like protein